jgi:hypothetical protein
MVCGFTTASRNRLPIYVTCMGCETLEPQYQVRGCNRSALGGLSSEISYRREVKNLDIPYLDDLCTTHGEP